MGADSGGKSKFSKKLLAIAVIIIVVVAVVVSWQIYGRSSNATKSEVTLSPLSLTLVGANGQQKILDSDELAALKSITAAGGYNDTDTGTIYTGNFTGVSILALLAVLQAATT